MPFYRLIIQGVTFTSIQYFQEMITIGNLSKTNYAEEAAIKIALYLSSLIMLIVMVALF
ncbi:MAG: hypothetical protein JST52_06420 [Bacteroidetes bacterium]|nr:hypothetical protein [Bacteroidota bacterium]MBS1739098.1 hypothetical protein [Bacteroidota bacterium]MBS1777213.1 hypothetical protein [Bacteroidota bacterium]